MDHLKKTLTISISIYAKVIINIHGSKDAECKMANYAKQRIRNVFVHRISKQILVKKFLTQLIVI